jgi:hypothetical protein
MVSGLVGSLLGLWSCSTPPQAPAGGGAISESQGQALVRRLNDRYYSTVATCPNGKAAFYCSGVLVQGVNYSATEHFWNAGDISQKNNTMSFSYIRNDERTQGLYLPNGYIVRELNVPADQALTARCFYPTNGYTNNMVNDGCLGSSLGYDGPCASQGVTTAQGWVDHFVAHGRGRSCSFGVSAQAFKTGLEAKALLPWFSYNEIVIAVWPQNIPERLPIEAFFWTNNRIFPNPAARVQARRLQMEFYSHTGRLIPVVEVNLMVPKLNAFLFNADDQWIVGSQAD